jgi:hypothetical protein
LFGIAGENKTSPTPRYGIGLANRCAKLISRS